MKVEAPVKRLIEKVPPSLIGILADEGKLRLPARPLGGIRGFRPPGLQEMAALQWVVEWDGFRFERSGALRSATGALAYRESYDFHSASDVREICFLTGSARAIRNLLHWAKFDARENGRRLIGSFGLFNDGLRKMVARLGGAPTRIVFEDLQ